MGPQLSNKILSFLPENARVLAGLLKSHSDHVVIKWFFRAPHKFLHWLVYILHYNYVSKHKKSKKKNMKLCSDDIKLKVFVFALFCVLFITSYWEKFCGVVLLSKYNISLIQPSIFIAAYTIHNTDEESVLFLWYQSILFNTWSCYIKTCVVLSMRQSWMNFDSDFEDFKGMNIAL